MCHPLPAVGRERMALSRAEASQSPQVTKSQTEQQADNSGSHSQAADGEVRAYREQPRVQGSVTELELEGSMKILTLNKEEV